jgi:hypothetical protein
MRRNALLIPLLLLCALPLAACPGAGAPEGAEPADTIAPAPQEPIVPGADEPGPNDNDG